jgi:hypothetical protein
MPRSSVLLSSTPLDAAAISAAASAVWQSLDDPAAEPFALRVLDEGAALQVLAGQTVLVSVLRPRVLPALDEVARLVPGVRAPEGASWWTEAYTPWRPEGAVGVAILDAAAAASAGAVAVHQGRARARRIADEV